MKSRIFRGRARARHAWPLGTLPADRESKHGDRASTRATSSCSSTSRASSPARTRRPSARTRDLRRVCRRRGGGRAGPAALPGRRDARARASRPGGGAHGGDRAAGAATGGAGRPAWARHDLVPAAAAIVAAVVAAWRTSTTAATTGRPRGEAAETAEAALEAAAADAVAGWSFPCKAHPARWPRCTSRGALPHASKAVRWSSRERTRPRYARRLPRARAARWRCGSSDEARRHSRRRAALAASGRAPRAHRSLVIRGDDVDGGLRGVERGGSLARSDRRAGCVLESSP